MKFHTRSMLVPFLNAGFVVVSAELHLSCASAAVAGLLPSPQEV